MKDYTITEYTKLVDKLCQLSANINHYLLEEEKNNFEEWLFSEKNIGVDSTLYESYSNILTNKDYNNWVDSLIQNDIINIKDHIYLSLRESEQILDKIMIKIQNY
tara:strand:+ start:575 stop:889 length:315 start_codon:yes stop_codon:yes gene_type:complete